LPIFILPGFIDRPTALFPVANSLIFCTECALSNAPGPRGCSPSPVEPRAALLGIGPQELEAVRTAPTDGSGTSVQRFQLPLRQWGEAPCSQGLLGRRTADKGQESSRQNGTEEQVFHLLPPPLPRKRLTPSRASPIGSPLSPFPF